MTNTFVKSCCLVWYGWMVLSALYITMNDEVSRNSHGHHGSTHRELVQHTHSHGSHAFSHTLTSTLESRAVKRQLSYYFSEHVGSFHVSVMHQILIWTTGSLRCIRDHSCVCVYTQGLGTPTASPHNIFDLEKLTIFSCAPGGIWTFVLWILCPMLYQLIHPITPI